MAGQDHPAAVQLAQQLAELDKLKAEFISIASHELKTPLTSLLGHAELLIRRVRQLSHHHPDATNLLRRPYRPSHWATPAGV